MCTPIRQLVISNEKVPKVGLRVHHAWISGPGNTHPYVELIFVALMTADSLGMHKQETIDNHRGAHIPFERRLGQAGTLSLSSESKTSGKIMGFDAGMVTSYPVQSALKSVHKYIVP